MKKSLLALAVLAAASANAATVYDKDGTTLAVGGRVQAVAYNGNFDGAGKDVANLKNSARLNLAGNTKLTDWVSAFAFTEWNMADGNKGQDKISTRNQFVGLDFGSFGKVTAGKQYDAFYDVIGNTDIWEDCGDIGTFSDGDRRNGVIKYTYDNYGFFAQVSAQLAADKILVAASHPVFGGNYNVNGGFAAAAGYTVDIIGGPLSFKTGYSYLEGQSSNADDLAKGDTFKNFKQYGAALTYGNLGSGLYLAAQYNRVSFKMPVNTYDKKFSDGYEFVVNYGFENGIALQTGYLASDSKEKIAGHKTESTLIRKVPVLVTYTANSNFYTWAEASFDADSSETKTDNGTLLAAGARYIF